MYTYHVGRMEMEPNRPVRYVTFASFDNVLDAARLARRLERSLDRRNAYGFFVKVWRQGEGTVFDLTRWRRYVSVETRQVHMLPIDH